MTREAGSRRPVDDRRVKGRAALRKRATGLLLAIHRYARARAATQDDVLWCARAIDALAELLEQRRRED